MTQAQITECLFTNGEKILFFFCFVKFSDFLMRPITNARVYVISAYLKAKLP